MIETITIGDRKIAVKGVGVHFYQNGFPIDVSVDELKDQGIEVSYLHVADELYKNGWPKKRVIKTLENVFPDHVAEIDTFLSAATSGEPQTATPETGQEFIYSESGYENQREILFKWLWGTSPSDAINNKQVQDEIFKSFS